MFLRFGDKLSSKRDFFRPYLFDKLTIIWYIANINT